MEVENNSVGENPVHGGVEKDDDGDFKAPITVTKKESESSGYSQARSLPYIPCPLTEDPVPAGVFHIEIIKNGSVIQRTEIKKPRITIGRSRDADFPMDHTSISRFHACLLWNPKDGPDGSFFLIDLNSVHGTMVNKTKITGGKPVKLNSGNDVIKFGASSRLFVLISSRVDEAEQDEEDEETANELRARKRREAQDKEDLGCTWGLKDDMDDEEDDGGETDGSTPLGRILSLLQTGSTGPTPNEHAYSENPQKTIQHWFESEGYDFEFKVDYNNGLFKCSLELPIDGQDVLIDGESSSKKKDAVVNVCLRACQVLDKADVLFPWQRAKEVKRKKESSDSEDEVIDETDQYKHKKAKKMAAKNAIKEVLNFENLSTKWTEISHELQKLKAKLAVYSLTTKSQAPSTAVQDLDESKRPENDNDRVNQDVDALDAFMDNIRDTDGKNRRPMKTSLNVKIEQSKIRMTIASLEKEQSKVERLLKIAKPSFVLPALESVYSASTERDLTDTEKMTPTKEKTVKTKEKSDPVMINSPPRLETKVALTEQTATRGIDQPESRKSEPGKIAISLGKKTLVQKPASVFTETGDYPSDKPKQPGPSKPLLSKLPSTQSNDNPPKYGLIVKKPEKSKPKPEKRPVDYFNQEAYVEWLPPQGQTGDGKTALNDKYGY